jgi:hypothetical protein
VNVFRHDHISVGVHLEATPHVFQTDKEKRVRFVADDLAFAMATEGDEVRLSRVLQAL